MTENKIPTAEQYLCSKYTMDDDITPVLIVQLMHEYAVLFAKNEVQILENKLKLISEICDPNNSVKQNNS